MNGLTPLEKAVLDRLLAGDDPILMTLRAQAERAHVLLREYTGVGFFVTFDVPADAERVAQRTFHLGDVNATMEGLSHGAGFILFVKEGRLDLLEGFTYDEAWPAVIGNFQLSYQNNPRKLGLASPPATSA